MKLIDITVLILVFSFFFFFERKTNHDVVNVSKASLKKTRVPLQIPARTNQIPVKKREAPETSKSELNHVERDYVGSIEEEGIQLTYEFEREWTDQMSQHLETIEPHRAEYIFERIMNEKVAHQETLKRNLLLDVNLLSALNGESGYESLAQQVQKSTDPFILEAQHKERVKSILGDNYDYIKEKEEAYKETFK